MIIPIVTKLLCGAMVLMALLFVALWRVSRTRIRELRQALDVTAQRAADSSSAADQLGEMAKLHERRAGEFFGIIAGVEAERDTWQRLYRESSRKAGVAQAWLVRDMIRAVQTANMYAKRLRAKGEKVTDIAPDPELQHVVEEFAGAHVPGNPEIKSTDATALARAVDNPSP